MLISNQDVVHVSFLFNVMGIHEKRNWFLPCESVSPFTSCSAEGTTTITCDLKVSTMETHSCYRLNVNFVTSSSGGSRWWFGIGGSCWEQQVNSSVKCKLELKPIICKIIF